MCYSYCKGNVHHLTQHIHVPAKHTEELRIAAVLVTVYEWKQLADGT